MPKQYYVYLMANKRNSVIYTGVTNDLPRRTQEHKSQAGSGFTAKYQTDKLVYYEVYDDPQNAISREKQIKAGSRKKKEELIRSLNPRWQDLALDL